jgi:hypothetical protein
MESNNWVSYGKLEKLSGKLIITLCGLNERFWNDFGCKNNPSCNEMQNLLEFAKTGKIIIKTIREKERQFIDVDNLDMSLVNLMKNFDTFKNTSHI